MSAVFPDAASGERATAGGAEHSVVRVSLTNFRSYASAELMTRGIPVVLAGPNGAGKTNLLDAISLLSPGRGLRGAKLADHTRKGPTVSGSYWAVAASVSRGGEIFEIGTGLTLSASGTERRQVRLNGAPAPSSADLADIVQILWLTPAMDRLFNESTGGRRRFLDRLTLGFETTHARTSARYETAMRERARLLRFGPRDPAWLDGLESEMAETGIAVTAARANGVSLLNRALAERGAAGAFPCAQLTVFGTTDQLLEEEGADAQMRLQDRLRASRAKDAEIGRTHEGPHLSDLTVRHTHKRTDARDCSTGEQKALLISIILAHAWELSRTRKGVAPLLLLDEVAAHLDARRREALFEEILALGAQAWMTGTDLPLFAAIAGRAEVFSVVDSQFRRQE